MPEHGDYNSELKQWYCGYWMTKDEWMDIHHYPPPNVSEEKEDEIKKDEL
jgi:hypothetical protein